MKALILAAGQATRLRPLTDSKPKCLLPIGEDGAIFDIQMRALLRCGINATIIVTGYKADMLEAYARKHHPDMSFSFVQSERFADTGPAYSFWTARDLIDEPVVYLNSDVLFEDSVLRRVVDSPHDSATAIIKSAWDEEEVNVILDERSKVLKIGKTIPEHESDGEFVGVTKLSLSFTRAIIKAVETFHAGGNFMKFAADSLHEAIQSGEELFAVDVTGAKVVEIDTPEDYAGAHDLWHS